MERLATLNFQANDNSDIFLQTDLYQDNFYETDEFFLGLEDPQFSSVEPWIVSQRPVTIPVCVDGDTTYIRVWIKNHMQSYYYNLTIYLEYEEVDSAEFFTGENESI